MTRKEVMQNLVKEEAKNLKTKATKKELKNLNFKHLDPNSMYACVYGQVTGNCHGLRAIELINTCCSRVYNYTANKQAKDCKVNGKPDGKRSKENIHYWSPIEVFIQQEKNEDNGNNKKLIDYLKGNTTRLNFK